MIAKKVLLLLRHSYQSPVARSKLKLLTFFDKKTYLEAEIFFGFSNSEFINDNTFSLKDKKSDIGTLNDDMQNLAQKLQLNPTRQVATQPDNVFSSAFVYLIFQRKIGCYNSTTGFKEFKFNATSCSKVAIDTRFGQTMYYCTFTEIVIRGYEWF